MTVRDIDRERRAWVIDVATLFREPGSRRKIEASGHLRDLAVSGSSIDDAATVSVHALFESVSEGILVTATINAPWHGDCRRCLEPANGFVDTEVRELFSDDGADEAYPLGGALLDLAPMVQDACILELPLAPLCSASCRGLCPECGVNRNTERCTCAPTGDPRWAVLATLSDSASDGGPEKNA